MLLAGRVPTHVIEHFEHEAGGPLGSSAFERERDGGSLNDLVSGRAVVSSTADVVLDSTVAGFPDADPETDQLLVLLRQGAVFQRIGFEFLEVAKRRHPAGEHLRVVDFSRPFECVHVFKHGNPRLSNTVFGRPV
jgi:hypothetical protein